jgi:hypothetical protein
MKGQCCIAILLALMAQTSYAQNDSSANENNQSSKDSAAATAAVPDGEAHFTPDQLHTYYLCYERPDVQYLRKVFDAYLNGHGDREKEFDALAKWGKDYYRSKFIVCSLNPAAFGGSLITIMFQDRPDKVFQAWVYEKGGKNGEVLRGMDLAKFSDEDIRRMNIRYRQFLHDKTHAM